eukprot:3638224-Alexandrium_andersonii.AAC.1
MSASLVGSEMCIRDRFSGSWRDGAGGAGAREAAARRRREPLRLPCRGRASGWPGASGRARGVLLGGRPGRAEARAGPFRAEGRGRLAGRPPGWFGPEESELAEPVLRPTEDRARAFARPPAPGRGEASPGRQRRRPG